MVENCDFFVSCLHSMPPLEYCHYVWYGKTTLVCLPGGEKFYDMFSRFDKMMACDRQMD